VRKLAPLLLLIALAVPFGDAGAFPLAGNGRCDVGGAIRADAGGGELDPLGPDLLSPFAVASPAPVEGSPVGTGGPRPEITVLSRRALAPAVSGLAGPPSRARRDTSCRAALGPALRVFLAHPSTAPPRIA
jgi:hypothetical protein